MKTKHELRQEAVERLRETVKRHPVSLTNEYIVNALVGYDNWLTTTSDDAETIIDLLTDDDGMDDYAKLPVDADGKTIHIGDEICGYGYPTGGVYCKAIINERLILAGTDDEPYHEWLMWDAGSCRHYHKPTVEDLLVDYYKECQFHTSELGFVTDEDKERAWRDIATTFAAKLQEVMAE